jgi:hypothetical protein
MDKNVPDEHAINITGHNNLSSLNKYRTLNENRKHLFYIIFCDFNFCGPEFTAEIRLPQKLPVIRYS